jgi:YD repeat-containing protein
MGFSRICQVDDGQKSHAYDAMNRLTSKTVPSAPTVTYGYDLASRQTSVAQTAV